MLPLVIKFFDELLSKNIAFNKNLYQQVLFENANLKAQVQNLQIERRLVEDKFQQQLKEFVTLRNSFDGQVAQMQRVQQQALDLFKQVHKQDQ